MVTAVEREGIQPYDFPPFDQGQVSAASQAALYPGELYVCRNYYARSRGILWMRSGMALWRTGDTSESKAGTGLFEVRNPDGNIKQLKFLTDDIKELVGGQTGDWTSRKGSPCTMSGDQNNLWTLVEHYGSCYACNGAQILVWDFSAGGFVNYTPSGGPSEAGGVFSYMERLGFYNCGGEKHAVWISDEPGPAPVFSNKNKYYAGPASGNPVMGVIEKGQILRILSNPRGTFSFFWDPQGEGMADFSIHREDMSIGCISGQTIIDADDWILFLDSAGHIRAWDTVTGTQRKMRRLTMPIEDIMQEAVSPARNAYASACFVDILGQYWIMLTEDPSRALTEHNLTVALRIPDKTPFLVDPEDEYRPMAPAFLYSNTQKWKLNFITIWTNDNGERKPVGIDYNGIVYDLWSGGGDVSTDINAKAELPLSHYGMPGIRKQMETASIIFEQGTDGDASVFVQNNVELGKESKEQEFTIREAGVPIGEFRVGVDSIGSKGSQMETMGLSGLGARGKIKFRSVGQHRHGVGLLTVGTTPQGAPSTT